MESTRRILTTSNIEGLCALAVVTIILDMTSMMSTVTKKTVAANIAQIDREHYQTELLLETVITL
jgi:hypothetical protein